MESENRKNEAWRKATQEEMHRRGEKPVLSVNATLVPFADWDYYYVDRGWIVWSPNDGQSFQRVDVPEGFVSDLASVPRIFWQVLKPEGRHAYAAVVHDYLYWEQDRSRDEADLIFKIAMEDSNVSARTVAILYHAVRRRGQGAWEDNARKKRDGERRLLMQRPRDFKISWEVWKRKAGVFDTPEPSEEVPPYKAPSNRVR